MEATDTKPRPYRRIHPGNHRVMYRLHTDFDLTLAQIADLFGCSTSRVKQINATFRE